MNGWVSYGGSIWRGRYPSLQVSRRSSGLSVGAEAVAAPATSTAAGTFGVFTGASAGGSEMAASAVATFPSFTGNSFSGVEATSTAAGSFASLIGDAIGRKVLPFVRVITVISEVPDGHIGTVIPGVADGHATIAITDTPAGYVGTSFGTLGEGVANYVNYTVSVTFYIYDADGTLNDPNYLTMWVRNPRGDTIKIPYGSAPARYAFTNTVPGTYTVSFVPDMPGDWRIGVAAEDTTYVAIDDQTIKVETVRPFD